VPFGVSVTITPSTPAAVASLCGRTDTERDDNPLTDVLSPVSFVCAVPFEALADCAHIGVLPAYSGFLGIGVRAPTDEAVELLLAEVALVGAEIETLAVAAVGQEVLVGLAEMPAGSGTFTIFGGTDGRTVEGVPSEALGIVIVVACAGMAPATMIVLEVANTAIPVTIPRLSFL
jgi:hypothetical protein